MTAAQITTALAELADLHHQLGLLAWATRPTGHAPPGPRTPDLDAIEARHAIAHTITTWVRAYTETLRITPPATLTGLRDLVTWATPQLPTWLAAQPYADQAQQDLAGATTTARAVLARGEVAVVPVCGCPETGCAGTVRARVDRTAALLPTVLVCSADRAHRWGAGDWRQLRRDTAARWMTAQEVAALYGATVDAVWQMAHRRGWRRTRTRPVGYLASDVAGLTDPRLKDTPDRSA